MPRWSRYPSSYTLLVSRLVINAECCSVAIYLMHCGVRFLLCEVFNYVGSHPKAMSWGGAAKNRELFLGRAGGREVGGWRIEGSMKCLLATKRCRCTGLSTFESIPARSCCRTCHHSNHFDSFHGGHLLFAYVCTTNAFCTITGVFNIIACVCRMGMECGGFPLVYDRRLFPV